MSQTSPPNQCPHCSKTLKNKKGRNIHISKVHSSKTSSKTFRFSRVAGTNQNAIWSTEMFVNDYGTTRVRLDGATYEAKDIIKFDWEQTHHKFDSQTNEWIIDADALKQLTKRLERSGFSLLQDEPKTVDSLCDDLRETANLGDEISVTYRKKNNNGTNSYTGTVKEIYSSGARLLQFNRGDDQMMYIQNDQPNEPGLFTVMSYSPFVGTISSVRIR